MMVMLLKEYGNVMTTTVRQTTKKRYPGISSLSVYLGLGKNGFWEKA